MTFEVLTILEKDGKVKKGKEPDLSDDRLRKLYETMVQARIMDERGLALQRQGRIGFYLQGLGQEASHVGSAAPMLDSDWIFPAYRQPGIPLLRDADLDDVVTEWFGHEGDPSKGRQMPVHYSLRNINFVSISSPIGTQISHAVGAAMAAHAHIVVRVNNAGIFNIARMTETKLEDYEQIIAVNQTGVFLGMKAVASHMCATGRGSIINISSLAGMEGSAAAFAYGASKWAVRGMTKYAAQELGRHGVRVNSVHPGFIETDMMQQTPAAVAGKLDRAKRLIPLGRTAEPEEVANLVLFLASDESAYCTNSEFVIDGGLHR